ncbi:hypothetical protein C0J52_10735 [Blattella germanica]|nr:hypothetical protein C0J52_10735 [Blattella germanica]
MAELAEEGSTQEPKKPTKLSDHAREILKLTRDTEYFQSFLRVSNAEDEGERPARSKEARRPPEETPQPPQQQQLLEQQEEDEQKRQATLAAQRQRRKKVQALPEPEEEKSAGKTTFSQLAKDLKLRKGPKKGRRRSRGRRQEEIYTDKDRAAAVNMGTHDIKQSLKMKRRQDRTRALQIPEEAEPGTLLALGSREMRSGDRLRFMATRILLEVRIHIGV